MTLSNQRSGDVKWTTILGDGKFHLEVTEETPGAVKRVYETSDNKTGSKWELLFDTLEGKVSSLSFREGEYGNQLYLGIDEVVVCVGTASTYGEDMMKKIPNVDFSKPLTLQPYSFEDDKGKTRKGVTMKQGDVKLTNFFYDAVAKKNINGYPEPAGDVSTYSKDSWKMYFLGARMFMVDYITKNHLKEPAKSEADRLYEEGGRVKYDTAEADEMIAEMNKNF